MDIDPSRSYRIVGGRCGDPDPLDRLGVWLSAGEYLAGTWPAYPDAQSSLGSGPDLHTFGYVVFQVQTDISWGLSTIYFVDGGFFYRIAGLFSCRA
ncbi:MAG: hypothetical protein NTV55_16405 [Planctomycetota bacterium]|nr:hypothetical protein [Planctomycetota bacterium]